MQDDDSIVFDIRFSPDGTKIVSAQSSGYFTLWDVETGAALRRFASGDGVALSVAFSPDGAHVATGGADGIPKIWNVADGAQVASLYTTSEGEWLTLTPSGFFTNSPKGTDFLNIVRGVETFSVMQFYDHLHRPDLVEEALKGDREGKFKDAARRLNLDAVLKSGPAPHIELLPNRTEKAGDTVKLVLRIIDAGGGIGGKIVWRVNGTTQGDTTAPGVAGEPDPGRYALMQQTLTVDPGKRNLIEVVAYNHQGLLASPPYRVTIDPFGVTLNERPRLFVLAVGVDDYAKPDWRLRYAANDALSLGQALKTVGAPIFETVEITSLLNRDATETGITAAFERLGAMIKPRDVFVLYLAGHGRSIMGAGWFFLPPDLTLDGRQTIEANAIGQDKWQKWLARIPASKSVLILDACESGATEAFRGSDRERETVMSQLEHATGRNIIAATPSGKAAYEGYRSHGLLTYAVLDALHKPDGGGADIVRVYDLAAHVSAKVIEISTREFGVMQKPEPILRDDFPLGVRTSLSAFFTPATGTVAAVSRLTHIVTRAIHAHDRPADDAPVRRELRKNTLVSVTQTAGSWSFIEKDGERIGYVRSDALEEVN